jgi:hypothetical protein
LAAIFLRLFDFLLGLVKVGNFAERALADPASVGNPGEAFFHLVKFCFGQIFQRQEFVAGACAEPLASPFVRHE